MEYFDQVNEKDEVIGTTTREECHLRKLIHRVVVIYVFDKEGRLYIQEHKRDNKYDHSVGGHVNKGESYEEAAKREGYEELKISDPLKKVAVVYPERPDTMHMFGIFECTPSANWKFSPNEEVDKIFPMHIHEIVTLMNKDPELFTAGILSTMRKYIEYRKLPYTLNS